MPPRITRSLPALSLFLLIAPPGSASTVTQALDTTLASLVAQTGTPGAAATVTRGGQTIWSGAAGLADPSNGTPFTTTTLSSVASVTKLFTSTLITRLSEDKRLNLDDPIAGYLPQTIPGAETVTIRQLVDMTAGYRDVEGLPQFMDAFKDPNHVWTRDALFAEITAPQFQPGSQYDYSNTNYLLLGQIIDSTYPGGTSAAFRDYIAAPALLGNDVVFDRDPAVANRVADGFSTQNGVTLDVNAGATDLGVNTSVWGTLWTDGGIVASADGLARFADALYNGRILNPENTALPKECAFDYSGRCWHGFIGAFNGYGAFILHDSERDVTITAVLNGLDEDSFSQEAFLPGLVKSYIDNAEPSAVPLPAALPLLAAGLAALFTMRRARRRFAA